MLITAHRRNLAIALVGGVVALAAGWALSLPDSVSSAEEWVFRLVNDLPDWIEAPSWPFMQMGAIIAVPVVAVVSLALFRNWRIPLLMTMAGVGSWLLAKVIKEIVARGRPAAFLTDINLRPEWEGLGFPSGHAAIGFAIAVVLTLALTRPWRWAVWSVAVIAGLLRMYTGAHLPLDVVGGWGMGAALGALALLVGDRLAARRAGA